MAEYIDKQAALKALCQVCVWNEKCSRYKNEPKPRCEQHAAIEALPAVVIPEDRDNA